MGGVAGYKKAKAKKLSKIGKNSNNHQNNNTNQMHQIQATNYNQCNHNFQVDEQANCLL